MVDKIFIIKNEKNEVICQRAIVASSFLSRLIGLMFKPEIIGGDGLLITGCNSIHTFFMRFSLDLIFLDKNFKVVKVIYNLSPWKMTWIYFKASQVLEMKAGIIKKDLKNGDKLEAICIN